MIRAKKIDYLGKSAIAIYFQNMTQHVNELRLEAKVLEAKNRNQSLESYTSTISHEFRTPLSTSLMFLESILNEVMSQNMKSMLHLIICQLNMLLCLVNDVVDIKMIMLEKYEPKAEEFSPLSIF